MKKSQNNIVSITSATPTRKPRTQKQTDEQRFKQNVGKPDVNGCRLWQGSLFSNGYGQFCADSTSHYAHRYAWSLAHKQPIPDGKYVLHSCDEPRCVAPRHLRLGDAKMNAADRESRNRGMKGRTTTRRKFTQRDITRVVEMAAGGATQYRIARALDRTEPTISRVLKRHSAEIIELRAKRIKRNLADAFETVSQHLAPTIAALAEIAERRAA